MAHLTEAELDAIQARPLGNLLAIERVLLFSVDSTIDAYSSNGREMDIKRDVFFTAVEGILSNLSAADACLYLASRMGADNLLHDLKFLRNQLSKGEIRHDDFRSLALCVRMGAPDIDIWTAVADLIPPSIQSPTPLQDDTLSSRAREDIEDEVFHELRHCTHRAVEGFHEKYFEGRDWNKQAERVWKEKAQSLPVYHDVWQWWDEMQSMLFSDKQVAYFRGDTPAPGARCPIKVYAKRRDVGEEHRWKDILVVGELSESPLSDRSSLLRIGSAVQNIFAAQPTRLFVHAFTLTNTHMEAWIFDRSGAYSGGPFDSQEAPESFIKIMCGYLMMSNEELGFDTLTERRDNKLFLTVPLDGLKLTQTFELDPVPIAHPQSLVGNGTACFRAKVQGPLEYDHVIKYSWTRSSDPPEADLLREAHKRGVEGIVKLVGYHEEITRIIKLRSGLKFPSSHESHDSASDTYDEASSFTTVDNQLGRRKPSDVLSLETDENQEPAKDIGNNAPKERQSTSLARRDDRKLPYDDRILRILVISPAGRSIGQFRSGYELLRALRDAITAHRSLYLVGNILHRDISANNIIIMDPAEADGFTGVLIDLDRAQDLGQVAASDTPKRVGTQLFMAIDVLAGVACRTYRHDLESFFYVLVWLCIQGPRDQSPPEETRLAAWQMDIYEDSARIKRGDMDVSGFEPILSEFHDQLAYIKPLCRELRDILFPYGKRGLNLATPSDPDALYGPILRAFDATLNTMWRVQL
ncbi:serine/threonine-protein kinase Sgk2 [Xylaria sp. CBS 124048]|nr:serine/threonine-protein kinase Sgk2 [Xylaria sp. CBS 124048]